MHKLRNTQIIRVNENALSPFKVHVKVLNMYMMLILAKHFIILFYSWNHVKKLNLSIQWSHIKNKVSKTVLAKLKHYISVAVRPNMHHYDASRPRTGSIM